MNKTGEAELISGVRPLDRLSSESKAVFFGVSLAASGLITMIRLIALFFLLATSAASAHIPEGVESYSENPDRSRSAVAQSARFKYAKNGKMQVSCEIAGVSRACLLDTGGHTSMLPTKKWSTKIETKGKYRVASVSGQLECDEIELPTLSALDFRIDKLHAVRCPKTKSDFYGYTVLGVNVFSGKTVFFDFKRHSVTTSQNSSIKGVSDVLEITSDKKWYIPVTVGGAKTSAMFDTGVVYDGMIDEDFVRANPEKFRAAAQYEVSDILGGKSLVTVYAASLRLAGKDFDVYLIGSKSNVFKSDVNGGSAMILGLWLIKRFNWLIDTNNRTWSAEYITP